jgi:hypothetical protein
MIGDPLYELMQRRRDEKKPSRRPAVPRPEGVTIYECRVLIWTGFGEDEKGPIEAGIPCRQRQEAKPYLPIPWHHGQPMAIAGYDWERDVT